jgi:hypothetical protein
MTVRLLVDIKLLIMVQGRPGSGFDEQVHTNLFVNR